LDMQQEIKKLE